MWGDGSEPIEPLSLSELFASLHWLNVIGSQVLRFRDPGHAALRFGKQHTRPEHALAPASLHQLLFERRTKVAVDFWITDSVDVGATWEGRQLGEGFLVGRPIKPIKASAIGPGGSARYTDCRPSPVACSGE